MNAGQTGPPMANGYYSSIPTSSQHFENYEGSENELM